MSPCPCKMMYKIHINKLWNEHNNYSKKLSSRTRGQLQENDEKIFIWSELKNINLKTKLWNVNYKMKNNKLQDEEDIPPYLVDNESWWLRMGGPWNLFTCLFKWWLWHSMGPPIFTWIPLGVFISSHMYMLFIKHLKYLHMTSHTLDEFWHSDLPRSPKGNPNM